MCYLLQGLNHQLQPVTRFISSRNKIFRKYFFNTTNIRMSVAGQPHYSVLTIMERLMNMFYSLVEINVFSQSEKTHFMESTKELYSFRYLLIRRVVPLLLLQSVVLLRHHLLEMVLFYHLHEVINRMKLQELRRLLLPLLLIQLLVLLVQYHQQQVIIGK